MGYAFGYLACFALGSLGVSLVWRAIRSRPVGMGRAVLGAVLTTFSVAIVARNASFERALDFEPDVGAVSGRPDAVHGSWHAPDGRLEIHDDGTFSCAGKGCSALAGGGSWVWSRATDRTLRFQPARFGPVEYQVVRFRGTLRLTQIPEEPDHWDERFAFEQVVPATLQLDPGH